MNRSYFFSCLAALLSIALWLLPTGYSQQNPPLPADENPLTLQQQGIEIIENYRDHFRKTGDFMSMQPFLKEAEKKLLASHKEFVRQGDFAAAAKSLERLGKIQDMQGKPGAAIEYYQQAEQAARQAGDKTLQIQALIGLANAQTRLPDLGAAEKNSEQAMQLGAGITDKKLQFDVLYTAAQVQEKLANFNAAVDLSNRALAVANAAHDETSLLDGYLERGNVYRNLADKFANQGNFDLCLEALGQTRKDNQEAVRLARNLGFTGFADFITKGNLRNIDDIEKLRRDYDQPPEQAFKNNKSPMYSPKKPGDVFVNEIFVFNFDSPPSSLAEHEQRNRKEEQYFGVFYHPNAALQRFMDGTAQEEHGMQDEALASFLKAVELSERDRGKLREEKDRGSFMEDKTDYYYYAILQLLERRRHAEAFDLLERSRARAMADLLASRTPGFAKAEEQARYGEISNLKARIAAQQSRITGIVGSNDPQAKEKISQAAAEIEGLESQLAKLTERLAKESPKLGELLESHPVSLTQLQQSMKNEGFEMLQYLVLRNEVILWHISADQIHVVSVFLPPAVLREKLRKFQDSLSKPPSQASFDEQAARELYLFLIDPVSQWIKTKRLVIVPNEDLFSVPFHAFLNPQDNRFLGESYQISYAPSATVLLRLRQSGPIAGGKLLVVADPEFAPADPAAESEVDAVAKHYPSSSKVLQRPAQATEVKTLVDGYDLVHLSVHGRFLANEPMLSYLEFSPGGADDGKLTAAEMFGLPLGQCKLVVLSACETARAEVSNGNEVQGMLRGLLYAGANSVLMSYWKVDADATAQWMAAFYQAAQSQAPAEAARQAMVAVKAQAGYAHPYYWAGFMLVGR